ncbi:uncharacterized protein LODBEIA_P15470 [Lodderomyces beijingensis]|uniref:Ribosome-recycling factor, mitochondrial n=1 Tax=Lodderomyces beijingensis TaxID=1775926 RepID=A0ABP0ZI66_9ASCO
MFRSLIRTSPARWFLVRRIPSASTTTTPLRSLHATYTLNSKKNKSKSKKLDKEDEYVQHEAETEKITPTIDFKSTETKFENVLARFEKLANEIKLGKINPKIFDNLTVNVGNNTNVDEVPFTSVAQTSVKGRNFIVTMFDPSNADSIINAIIGSGLNMSGTIDPANKFNIRIPLPPITQETKKHDAKTLKELYEKFRNNKTGSMNSVRGETRSKFQGHLKHHKLSDTENKQLEQLEKLHKVFADKLQASFKSFEKAILK